MSATAQASISRVAQSRAGQITNLAPAGALTDEEILSELAQATEECLARREFQLVLDLISTPQINSVALDQILDLQDRLLKFGGWLKIANASDLLMEVFRITNVSQFVAMLDGKTDTVLPASSNEADVESPRKLGEILIRRGVINEKQLDQALKLQSKSGQRLGTVLVTRRLASQSDVSAALAELLSVPFVRVRTGLYDPVVAKVLDMRTCLRLRVMPLFKVRGTILLATTDAQSAPTLAEVEDEARCRVCPVLALRDDIEQALRQANTEDGLEQDLIGDIADDIELVETRFSDDYSAIDELAAGSPVINHVNAVIQRAVREGASDIHIEPFRNLSRVRFRIDGVLYEIMTLRMELHAAVVSRLKVMANLDIGERRLPQDGRIQVSTGGRAVDLRFSSLPGMFGEKIVLRVLDKTRAILDVEKLGMEKAHLKDFKQLLGRTHGLILVTGPTGSGKTTTLYAALSHLNSMEKNIVTIEDPVEYQMELINQNEVRVNIGLTFDRMLRHVLRQDPDIVMVGEIRDRQTAEVAVQASLTGHLVLSTLHTNDSVGVITRLIDMGVEPYLLSSALVGVIAQRLLRGICPECKTTFIAPPELVESYGWESNKRIRLAKGRGCPECFDSGYRGRFSIHEVLKTDEKLQKVIISNPSREQLTKYMGDSGVTTLFQNGLKAVREGSTTIEEVSRAINV